MKSANVLSLYLICLWFSFLLSLLKILTTSLTLTNILDYFILLLPLFPLLLLLLISSIECPRGSGNRLEVVGSYKNHTMGEE